MAVYNVELEEEDEDLDDVAAYYLSVHNATLSNPTGENDIARSFYNQVWEEYDYAEHINNEYALRLL